PAMLVILVHEREFSAMPPHFLAALKKLRDAGCRICVDGAGGSGISMENLIRVEPDFIKLDPAFTKSLLSDPGQVRFVKRMRAVAAALGAKLIAQGVEKAVDLKAWQAMKVDLGQGAFLGSTAAMPVQESINSRRKGGPS